MPIVLYHAPGSAPCHAVRLVAAALGINLEEKFTNLMEGQHLTPEFRKMNPQHAVPTLDDNGFYLAESRAICTYLIERYAKDDTLYPKDLQQRAIINQRLYFDLGTLYDSFIKYMLPQVLGGQPADPAKLEKCHEALEILEKLLEGKTYIAGDHLTVADLTIVTSAVCFKAIDVDLSKYKNYHRWIKQIASEAPKYNEIVEEGLKGYKMWIESAIKRNAASKSG